MDTAHHAPKRPSEPTGIQSQQQQPLEQPIFNFMGLCREVRDSIYYFYVDDARRSCRLRLWESVYLADPRPCAQRSASSRAQDAYEMYFGNWQLEENLAFPSLSRSVEGLMMVSQQIRSELMEAILQRPVTWEGSFTSTKWTLFKANLLPEIRDLSISVAPGITVNRPWNDLDNEIRQFLDWVYRHVSRKNQYTPWKLKILRLIGRLIPSIIQMGLDAQEGSWDHYHVLDKIRGCGVQVHVEGRHPTISPLTPHDRDCH